MGACKKFTYSFVYSENSMSSTTKPITAEKIRQVLKNFDYSLFNVLRERKQNELSKQEKKLLSVIIFTFIMHIFLLYILLPA